MSQKLVTESKVALSYHCYCLLFGDHCRAKNLPNVFKDSLKAPMPEKILTDAHKAKVLNKRPQQIQKRLEAMAIK